MECKFIDVMEMLIWGYADQADSLNWEVECCFVKFFPKLYSQFCYDLSFRENCCIIL
jgi:hypothetical protein